MGGGGATRGVKSNLSKGRVEGARLACAVVVRVPGPFCPGKHRGGARCEPDQSLLLPLELLHVELKLLALEDVAVEAAGLAGAGGDAGEEVVLVELVGDLLLELGGLAGGKLGLDVVGTLGGGAGLFSFFKLLLVEFDVVVGEVPLAEGAGVDAHDGVLHEGLGADELVVGRVVHDVEHAGLLRDGLGAPREGARVDAQRAVLQVASAALDQGDLLGAELGHGGGAAHLEESLLLVDGHAATSRPSLVSGVPRNTHTS